MNSQLDHINKEIYSNCTLLISDMKIEPESQGYAACQFKLNGMNIVCRNAKLTPKKAGQFVTFWKRKKDGPIEPFCETDQFDFFVVNVQNENEIGQFIFPKSVLIKKGIISTAKKEGKRAFRVYTSWDTVKSRQAVQTQKWQMDYFYKIGSTTDFEKVKALYTPPALV